MDFFAHQERAQRHTTLLIAYFALAVVAIVLSVYFVVAGVVQLNSERAIDWWNPELLAAVALGVLIVIGLGSLWQTVHLSSGGRVVAEMLGGQLLSPGQANLKQRRLLNVVEEMAIAAGTVVPPVYVMPKEQAINAFAAGFSPDDAVIGVSQGAIDKLTRDELQGVIGHEFSHILRGDMRLNIRLMGLLHGILLLSLIGTIMFRVAIEILRYSPSSSGSSSSSSSSSGDKKGGNPILAIIVAVVLIGAGLYIIGYIGVFFGQLIKSAVSRQREYLADASSVQFTRNPHGLAGALKRIGATIGSRLKTSYADEAAHLFFANGVRERFLSLLATHPPLADRIQRIDPDFDGRLIAEQVTDAAEEAISDQTAAVAGFAAPQADVAAPVDVSAPVVTAEVVSQVGHPDEGDLHYAAEVRSNGWGPLDAWLNDAYSASALIFALLISGDENVAARQFSELGKRVRSDLIDATKRVLPLVAGLDRTQRLPLVEVAATALFQLSKQQYEQFSAMLETLVVADAQISLFEYALQRLLVQHLRPHYFPRQRRPVRITSINDALPDIRILLGTLAAAGNTNSGVTLAAFQHAAAVLGQPELKPLDPSSLSLDQFDQALDRLIAASPKVKRQLVAACAECVSADGRIEVNEAQLLRVICATLDCPLPPAGK